MADPQNDTTMQDHNAGYSTEAQMTNIDQAAGRWLDSSDVLEAELPTDLQEALGRFVGEESVPTLGEWATEIRQLTGSGSIAVGDLCHASGETDHWGESNGERYYFQCFYDAVILAAVQEQPVDIHTVSPADAGIDLHAAGGDELSVTPETAVFSLGIAESAGDRSGGKPTLEDGYAAICPYVKAFPDYDAYEQWAGDVAAVTVALPLAGATDVADALVA